MRSKPISKNQITLSRNQAADVLGVNPSTIDRMIKKGKLPKVQITDMRIGILKTDIDAFVLANRSQVAA
jgi:excisionase family DNA binding protein